MVGRRVQGGARHAADGLDVRGHLGRGQEAAVPRLGTLTDLDEHARGIGLHAGHGPDDAVPAEVPGRDLQDHVAELVGFQQAHGHAALAGAHADGQAADLVEVGRGQGDGLPGAGGERANAHVAEDDGIDPVDGRGAAVQHQIVPVTPQGQVLRQHDPAQRGAHVEGVALGIQRRVGHLADAAHHDGVQRALGVEVGAAAALEGPPGAGQQGKAVVRVADGPYGPVGADLFAHAAAHAGAGEFGALPDDRTRPVLLSRRGERPVRQGQAVPPHAHFNGVEGAGRHAGAAERAARLVIVDLPAQIVAPDILGPYCFHLCTARSLSMSTSSRSLG